MLTPTPIASQIADLRPIDFECYMKLQTDSGDCSNLRMTTILIGTAAKQSRIFSKYPELIKN